MDAQTKNLHFYDIDNEEQELLDSCSSEFMNDLNRDSCFQKGGFDEDANKLNIEGLLHDLSFLIATQEFDTFCEYVTAHNDEIALASCFDESIISMVLIGYKAGIAQQNGSCANDLGALYYMGDLVEQDYKKAGELYELAIQWGCDQSIINMGYIYEYGRIGEPNYAKAFEYYSLAAALTQMSEALYKLGDMYSRGHSVTKSVATAVQLWKRSYEKAQTPIEIAQPAIRLAPLYLDGSEEAKIAADPVYALHLYQQAEIGLRIDINEGQTYYKKRLHQAIEGQEKARLRLDNTTIA